MEIEILDTLSEEKERKIRELSKRCGEADGIEGDIYLSTELNYDKSIPAFYLGYEGGELAAFLLLFMPEKMEAEVTAFTDPSRRRKGHFSRLYREASRVCRENGIRRLLLVIDERSAAGKAALGHLGDARYQFSEYRLELRHKETYSEIETVRFKEIAEEEREVYDTLALRALEMGEEREEFRQAVLQNPSRHGYIQYWRGTPVGMFHLSCEEGETCIHGVGILPEYRGRGLGNVMIKYAAHRAWQFGQPVVIEVDSQNERAYHLYRKNGFEVVQQMNYFGVTLEDADVEKRC